MAENPFLAQLLGVNTSPYDTTYGQLSEAIGAATPRLVNPYASPGRNLASVAGAGLLAGLLGYQAKREAEAENRAVLPQLTALLGAKSPEEMATVTQQEAFPNRMLPLAQQMMLSQYTSRQDAAAKRAAQLAELETAGQFELGPIGTELFKRKQFAEQQRQEAISGGFFERQQFLDQLLRGRAEQRKQLELEALNIPAPLRTKAIEKNASANLALDVAKTIDTYTSIPEFVGAKNISAFGDDQLKSRLRNLATVVLQSRSGLAATDTERENLRKILVGDFTAVAPNTVAGILKRFAKDERNLAAETLAAATNKPEVLITEMRRAAEEGRPTEFDVRIPQFGQLTTQTPLPSTTEQPGIDSKLEVLRQLQAEIAAIKAQRG
jgi:hypothetical protein